MASADFCRPVPTPCDAGSTRQTGRSPRVMRVTFLPYTRRIYNPTLPDDYRALKISAFSPGWDCLVCGFCSSGREFACSFLQIPPRGGHPCRPASGSRHQGPQGTFTPKSSGCHHDNQNSASQGATRHAWRTEKSGAEKIPPRVVFGCLRLSSSCRRAPPWIDRSSAYQPRLILAE